MAPQRPLAVKIVGGGIAGLTAAIALRQAGHNVEVLERSSFANEYGAGIGLVPNAVKILRSFGLCPQRDARANKWLQSSSIKADTMEVIRKEWIECEGRLGAPMLVAHRVDLHSALKRHAVSEDGSGIPAALRNQVKVVLFEPEKGLIHLEDGTVEHGDLIIAADGVRSSAASIMNGIECPATLTTTTQIRFMISTELILNDPVTAPLLDDGPNDAGFYVSPGHGGYLVRYPCRESTLQNFGLYTLADPRHTDKQEWKFPMDRDYLRRQMHGFSPVLLRLCDLAPEISLWRLPGRKPIAKFQRGKMVAIGDAAHPMHPHRGQGAVFSIEDAAALGVLFNGSAEPSIATWSVEEKLQLFGDIRQKRVSAIQIMSGVPLFEDAMAAKKAELMQYLPESELPVDNRDLREWLFKHDYRQAIREKLRSC